MRKAHESVKLSATNALFYHEYRREIILSSYTACFFVPFQSVMVRAPACSVLARGWVGTPPASARVYV